MFPNQKQFFHLNKKWFFQILDSKQKKYFSGFLNPKQKKTFLDSSDPNKKIFFTFLATQTKKEYFTCRFPQPKRGISMTKSLLFSVGCFSVGRLFHQQKVGHGNETEMFRNQKNNSFIQKQKNIFQIHSTQTQKKYFIFLDPNKKYFLYSST